MGTRARAVQVRELNSMLKAWEAMRLSKDAQIAALMERCKRYDEDVAEKARSNDALRRKLHHQPAPAAAPPRPLSDTMRSSSGRGAPSVASSVASEGGRARHIHLHMHPSLRGSAASWQPGSARSVAGGAAGEFAAALGPAQSGWEDAGRP